LYQEEILKLTVGRIQKRHLLLRTPEEPVKNVSASMKVDLKIQLLKFCFTLFNSVFLALGLSVAGCAVWILFDTGNFLNILPTDELRTVGAGLLVSGGVVLLVGGVGCFGAHGENRFFLLMYLGFLIVIFLGQLFISLLLILSEDKIEQSLDAVVDQTISQYGGNHTNTNRLLDNVQHYGKYCGRTGPADWLKNSFIQSLNLTNPDIRPCSCFGWSYPDLNSPWCSDLLNITTPLFGRGNVSYEQ
ncbi:CD82 antigen, partial [Thalassophryne amazonica]|uniref:CD82 antigen n=1 Tax=Thalassophryne amazonica TaxID=390379 RepID=UPI0014713E8C